MTMNPTQEVQHQQAGSASDTTGSETIMAPETHTTTDPFADEVRTGLTDTPKHLSSKFLYDEVGSRLFEAICALPEYYLTRTEESILDAEAHRIVAKVARGTRLVEFGAGSAVKTRILIRALLDRQDDLVYCPIDISDEAMRTAQANVEAEFPHVGFKGILGEYDHALEQLGTMKDTPKLILFLGSSIGNFTPSQAVAFLASIRRAMGPDDHILLGTDLAKDIEVLKAAYDDPAGVTAAFDKNLLARINRELGGGFDLGTFAHEARWNPDESRMEMHLVSQTEQRVPIAALGIEVDFAEGESIHTENSYKYTDERVHAMADRAGLEVTETWTDPALRFALHLIAPA